jgi:ferredoxin
MNEEKKHPLSAPGRYYVDRTLCIACGNSVNVAPNNLKMSEEMCAYVFKQPETAEEEAQCRQALEECPTEAIRDDG